MAMVAAVWPWRTTDGGRPVRVGSGGEVGFGVVREPRRARRRELG